MRAAEVRRLAQQARVGSGVSVLDLCCGVAGPGRMITAESGCHYLGVDHSASALATARQLAGNLPCRFEQAHLPPLPEGRFEVVFLLETMLERFKANGLLKPRGRQRTDSSHVLAAVRILNRLECVGETVRHALNSLAVAAPDWLAPQLDPAWADRYGPRFDEYRLPKGTGERHALADQIGEDGVRLLAAIDAVEAPPALRSLPAVETLRQVWIQQYQITDEAVHWRDNDAIPPSGQMISSPHDLDARYAVKRQTSWTGYKVHLTEVCDPDMPHLITHVETTLATVPDAQLPTIHQALATKGLLPSEHIVDAGYVDSEAVVASQDDHCVVVVGPVPPDTTWQARANAGFDISCFALDWEARRACSSPRSRDGASFHRSREDRPSTAARAAGW